MDRDIFFFVDSECFEYRISFFHKGEDEVFDGRVKCQAFVFFGWAGWRFRMGMEVSNDLVSVCSGIFEGCKLLFGIHGKMFSAGIHICEEIDLRDGDLFVFFCSCKEAAGFIWEAGGAMRQDGIIV